MTPAEHKIQQLIIEKNCWKRLVEGIINENIYLKIKLSEMLKKDFAPCLLDDAEDFQNMFIKTDQLVVLLRHDIADLEKILQHPGMRKKIYNGETLKRINSIRENITIAKTVFSCLQEQFKDYIKENV